MDFRPLSISYWELQAKSLKFDTNCYDNLTEITLFVIESQEIVNKGDFR